MLAILGYYSYTYHAFRYAFARKLKGEDRGFLQSPVGFAPGSAVHARAHGRLNARQRAAGPAASLTVRQRVSHQQQVRSYAGPRRRLAPAGLGTAADDRQRQRRRGLR
jgi:hypothetical protein